MNRRFKWVIPLTLLAIAVSWAIAGYLAPAHARTKPFFILMITFSGILAGLVYLIGALKIIKNSDLFSIKHVLIVFLFLRIPLLVAPPILEDDYYRYMWDGAVTAHGINPYRWSPEEILNHPSETLPSKLLELRLKGKHVLQSINHPQLKTIYPPVAQIFFAMGFILSPWSPVGLRLIYFLVECFTILIYREILKILDKPFSLTAIILWNPLLFFETYMRVHMDILLFPFLLMAFYLMLRRHPLLTGFMTVLASAIKIWPIILIPLWIRFATRSWKAIIPPLVASGTVFLLVFLPLLHSGFTADSGVMAYGKSWENNDFLYRIMQNTMIPFFDGLGFKPWHARLAVRVFGAFIILIGALAFAIPKPKSPREVAFRTLFISAGLFYLSPTQFPWYALWWLPFMVFHPYISLFLATPLLFLYNTGFLLDSPSTKILFVRLIIPLEHLPVLLFATYEFLSRKDPASSL